jgi:hypothetical protein
MKSNLNKRKERGLRIEDIYLNLEIANIIFFAISHKSFFPVKLCEQYFYDKKISSMSNQ